MVPLVKVPKKEGQAYLSVMQLVKGLKKGEPTFIATIASSDEDNGAKDALPPCIEKVLEENKDMMPEELPRHLSLRREVDHKIKMEPGARPPAYPSYRMAPPELEEIRKQLKELFDARTHLNSSTYFEINMMGPHTYAKKARILGKFLRGVTVVVYLDDIIIYSNTLEEHVEHLMKVFQVLCENELFIKWEKCEFDQYEVHLLGYIISQGELRMDEEKVRAIKEWEVPTKVTELRSFIGLTNYYCRFISAYSAKAASLTELLKKNKPWGWSEEC
ncbi:uncharacterized protein LOC129884378 [Solanum dulcamara]|uniref:uncharacterized protein LOC129884378 n=1 Tax=Solanum dulcamara TaxID=45834 RepID=UPI002485A6DF|nr:uncharacterized protein LOC129884378 [Solanum dulcamara]